MRDFWVFGYGSLMWKPDFPHDDIKRTYLYGYHRSLCITSVHHRGRETYPGLVLGLDRGGSCVGLAFHVPADQAKETYRILTEREQSHGVYEEKYVTLRLDDRSHIQALAYVADRHHQQYAGVMDIQKMANIVAKAHGLSGPNRDYVINTHQHLVSMGLKDKKLDRIVRLLKQND